MSNTRSTEEQRHRLIGFRQTLYEKGFARLRDVLFELLDALLLSGPVRSFAEISRSPVFRRGWPSLYAALADGRVRGRWIEAFLTAQVPEDGPQVFILDATAWPRAQAPTLPDRQYVHSPTAEVKGKSVVVGVPYSALSWRAEPTTSWALPLEFTRIASARTAVEEGVRQVKRFCRRRKGRRSGLDVIVADAAYGNHRFLRPLKHEPVGIVVRLRKDRVLYGRPGPYSGFGRPAVHGDRFAFKAPETWPEPDERTTVEDARWGTVELRRWNGLHAKEAADTPFAVVRVAVHAEREKPPAPLWLAWQAPAGWTGEEPSVEQLWRWYGGRYGIEASFRWRNQELHGRLPRLQSNEAGDRWNLLVTLGQWLLYLARGVVLDDPLPWQKPQAELSPSRVQRGLGSLFAQIGTPAVLPQTRGKSPGWPKGRERTRPARHPVVKKTPKKAKTRRKAPPTAPVTA